MSDAYDFSQIDPTVADVNIPDLTAIPAGGSFSDIFAPSAPIVPAVQNLPSTPSGLTDIFRNITDLAQTVYQGETALQQAAAQRQIANAKLANQLTTIRTTPNIWMVLGLGAAAVFVLELMDRGRSK